MGGSSGLILPTAQLPEFSEIYRVHHAAVYGACLHSLRDHHHAQDAVQETFLRAHGALGRFEGAGGLRAWLLRIAHNVCVDHCRRVQRAPLVAELHEAHDVGRETSPEDLYALTDLEVGGAWPLISSRHRMVLRLRHVEGLSHVEIAALLGQSAGQTKALLHRALRALRLAWTDLQGAPAEAA